MFNLFKSTSTISLEDIAKNVLLPNTSFIDVRTKEEYNSGHAKGTVNLPLQTLNDKNATDLQKYESVYVICQSGGRSAQATSFLLSKGVKAINVPGGTSAWRAKGLPMA